MKLLRISLYITLFVATITGLAGCDKMDDNGPFEGYWLLMDYDGYDGNRIGDISAESLVTEGGNLITDIETQTAKTITWGVRNQLIQISNLNNRVRYFCHFSRNYHELILLDAYANDGSNDTKIEFSEMAEYLCIPDDGKFEIVSLTNKQMVLKADSVTMTFKKN